MVSRKARVLSKDLSNPTSITRHLVQPASVLLEQRALCSEMECGSVLCHRKAI